MKVSLFRQILDGIKGSFHSSLNLSLDLVRRYFEMDRCTKGCLRMDGNMDRGDKYTLMVRIMRENGSAMNTMATARKSFSTATHILVTGSPALKKVKECSHGQMGLSTPETGS